MSSRVHRLIACAAGLGLVLLGVLLAAYFVGPIGRADATALVGLSSLSENHRWLYVVGDALAHSVDLVFMVPMLILIAAAGVAWGRRRQALGAVVLVGGACVLTQGIKIAAAHPRFQPILEPHQLSHQSFPSGHTTAVMSLALAAVLVVPSRWRSPTAALAGGYALVVSIALVVQGWHFPSDVLGAYLVVGLVSMLVIAGLAATQGESPQRRTAAKAAGMRLRTAGLAVLQLGLIALAIVGGALLATHPGALASYAAANTTAVVAAIGIAAVSLGLVSGVTAELEAG